MTPAFGALLSVGHRPPRRWSVLALLCLFAVPILHLLHRVVPAAAPAFWIALLAGALGVAGTVLAGRPGWLWSTAMSLAVAAMLAFPALVVAGGLGADVFAYAHANPAGQVSLWGGASVLALGGVVFVLRLFGRMPT